MTKYYLWAILLLMIHITCAFTISAEEEMDCEIEEFNWTEIMERYKLERELDDQLAEEARRQNKEKEEKWDKEIAGWIKFVKQKWQEKEERLKNISEKEKIELADEDRIELEMSCGGAWAREAAWRIAKNKATINDVEKAWNFGEWKKTRKERLAEWLSVEGREWLHNHEE